MSGSRWDWNGARWWRFDLHTHTPASKDYGKGPNQETLKKRTPKDWLLDHIRAGLDCVAVTDHNSGAWVDELKRAFEELEVEEPDDFRSIHLFAGVEISVSGGVHVLAILGNDKTTADIDSLLGAVGFPSAAKGSCDAETRKSFVEVIAEIEAAGGIAIPAHVDGDKGLFKLQGNTLTQALECKYVLAMEIIDPEAPEPPHFSKKNVRWTKVLGSDSHQPSGNPAHRFPGSHFSWVKMGSPTLEGLRLALLDGPISIRRSDQETGNPNDHAPLAIESIEVSDAVYIGRPQPFLLKLNPWLNAIIGGRGTGKSTIIEFLRLALRRQDEVPKGLEDELGKYAKVSSDRNDPGLLTDRSTIRVIYRKDGTRFRVQWSVSGDLDPIEEEIAGGWRRAEGDVSQRFLVRIYSQKQVFHLARSPLALLGVIDEAPEVDRRSWNDRWKEEEGRFLSLHARAREIEAGFAEEPRLRGELDDVERKLAVFEEAGHADILREFQRRSRQRRAVEAWDEGWADIGTRLRELATDLIPDPLDSGSFDFNREGDAELHTLSEAARNELTKLSTELDQLAGEADRVISDWRTKRNASAWNGSVDAALAGYAGLRQRLAVEGAGDPAAYGELVQRRQTLEQRLTELGGRKAQVEALRTQAEATLQRLLALRRVLTESRRSFLAAVLKDNPFVRIQIVPFGARDTAEGELRRLLLREGGGFDRDIGSPDGGGLLGDLFSGETDTTVEQRLAGMKQELRIIAAGRYEPASVGDQRFATHMRRLPPELLDRIDLWFPEDALDVQYSPTGDGRGLRSIQEGSPGQRTAALLAFLLSYGKEPLVLDQPEDDLDNHLIYDLIVQQLRQVKRQRQIIVVTHNPNIVVNGDAELVVALVVRSGQTQMESEGSLQEKHVRKTICEVMEGGSDAFKQRYDRIALEGRHV